MEFGLIDGVLETEYWFQICTVRFVLKFQYFTNYDRSSVIQFIWFQCCCFTSPCDECHIRSFWLSRFNNARCRLWHWNLDAASFFREADWAYTRRLWRATRLDWSEQPPWFFGFSVLYVVFRDERICTMEEGSKQAAAGGIHNGLNLHFVRCTSW